MLRDVYMSDDAAEVTDELLRVQTARAHLKPTDNKVLEHSWHTDPLTLATSEDQVGPRRVVAAQERG